MVYIKNTNSDNEEVFYLISILCFTNINRYEERFIDIYLVVYIKIATWDTETRKEFA